MADEPEDDDTTGCCVIYNSNVDTGRMTFDGRTRAECKKANEDFNLGQGWDFYPNTACSQV
ncbi:MAG: hypothetical protein B7Z08_03945 [Sphingomonadales bacterium 32-68-7]|nr:MAG: hypothetical protein B7Z33_13870 [Sphingomonadales bacterium 12-68-11]OYX09689.1 MAG: hypothetical protein B7Z08_03945 [Sphingomonadales bacterium 32-68-7]